MSERFGCYVARVRVPETFSGAPEKLSQMSLTRRTSGCDAGFTGSQALFPDVLTEDDLAIAT